VNAEESIGRRFATPWIQLAELSRMSGAARRDEALALRYCPSGTGSLVHHGAAVAGYLLGEAPRRLCRELSDALHPPPTTARRSHRRGPRCQARTPRRDPRRDRTRSRRPLLKLACCLVVRSMVEHSSSELDVSLRVLTHPRARRRRGMRLAGVTPSTGAALAVVSLPTCRRGRAAYR